MEGPHLDQNCLVIYPSWYLLLDLNFTSGPRKTDFDITGHLCSTSQSHHILWLVHYFSLLLPSCGRAYLVRVANGSDPNSGNIRNNKPYQYSEPGLWQSLYCSLQYRARKKPSSPEVGSMIMSLQNRLCYFKITQLARWGFEPRTMFFFLNASSLKP